MVLYVYEDFDDAAQHKYDIFKAGYNWVSIRTVAPDETINDTPFLLNPSPCPVCHKRTAKVRAATGMIERRYYVYQHCLECDACTIESVMLPF